MKTVKFGKKAAILAAVCVLIFLIDPLDTTGALIPVNGESLATNLPASLPIGDKTTVMDWIVAGRTILQFPVFSFDLTYTDTNGEYRSFIYSGARDAGYFPSYEKYLDTAEALGMPLVRMMIGDGTYLPGSILYYRTVIYYAEFAGIDIPALFSDTNVGTLDDVSTNVFRNINVLYAFVVVPVPKLQKVRIEVGTPLQLSWYTLENNIRSYSTNTATTRSWPGRPELYKDNFLCLSSWYCVGTNKVRIWATVGEGSMTATAAYTQYGEKIREPILTISPHNVRVSAAKGSDVTIEDSCDMQNWTVYSNHSLTNSSELVVPIQMDKPRRYFRSFCR